MHNQAGSLGGRIPSVRFDKPSVLSLVLNNICPLNCAHCYLQPEDSLKTMKPEHWLRFLKSVFMDLPSDAVCFSGKEVFALNESAEIFFEAIRLREEIQAGDSDRTRLGVITNGVLLSRYRKQLFERQPDWFDISIDGLEQAHDAVRGEGAFAKMADNLPWLVEMLGNRLWITPTLMQTNVDLLPEIVESLHARFGLKQFSAGIYKQQSYTSPTLCIPDTSIESRVLGSLLRLSTIANADGIEVHLTFNHDDLRLRRGLEAEGLIPAEGILRTSKRTFENGLTLVISTISVPVGLWRAVRVTSQGQWLAAEDLNNAKEYEKRAIAKLADFDYDARRLYMAGLAHVRFREIFGMAPDRFLTELSTAA